jgi:hemolysin III
MARLADSRAARRGRTTPPARLGQRLPVRGGPGNAPVLSTTIYSLSVCGLFGVSALYHRRVWTPRGYQVMRRLDHSMIFVLIAGTYTPFSVLLLPDRTATVILAIVWGGAVLGVAVKLIWPHAPRWLSAPLYLALGWVAVAVLPDLLRHGGVSAFALITAGGLAHSAGAILYALRRPNPWPGTFGHHGSSTPARWWPRSATTSVSTSPCTRDGGRQTPPAVHVSTEFKRSRVASHLRAQSGKLGRMTSRTLILLRHAKAERPDGRRYRPAADRSRAGGRGRCRSLARRPETRT